jgi:hypothetical protein
MQGSLRFGAQGAPSVEMTAVVGWRLFALVGLLLLGFEEAAQAVEGTGLAEDYQAFG